MCILLTLTLSLASFSQTLNKDTTRCLGITQLREIAIKLIKCKECDTLLKISDKQLAIKDSILNFKSLQITNLTKQVNLFDTIVMRKDSDIKRLTNDLNSSLTREKYWSYGCIGAGTAALLLTILFIAQ